MTLQSRTTFSWTGNFQPEIPLELTAKSMRAHGTRTITRPFKA